jgi:AcrR family transcriptional regulator
MSETALSTEIILDTAEQLLRRFGPAKTSVVDVARALNVSHGSIYRYFPSKTALRESVAERWLHRVSTPLAGIYAEPGSASERLRRWFDTLMSIKRSKMQEDPELFTMYHNLAEESDGVVKAHLTELVSQLTRIIEDGLSAAEFKPGDAGILAAALLAATTRFHHPVHAHEWLRPEIDRDFDNLWNLLLSGLLR